MIDEMSARSKPYDHSKHSVLFYDDAFPAKPIADYLWGGLAAGAAALAIATPDHNGALRACLEELGADLGGLEESGRLVMFDARMLLDRIMDGDQPDGERFLAVVGDVVDRAVTAAPDGSCRAYGEMEGVLADEGLLDAAIALEGLWNKLLAARRCGLYCAYPLSQFAHPSLADSFERICDAHHHVISAAAAGLPAEHGRSVTTMQQRAQEADVAARRRSEEDLRRHRDYLEELVRERTEELRIAKERAEAASEAKSVFLANMSHELRTPLHAILGHAQLLRQDATLEARAGTALTTIQESGQHLLALINDLLDLAKIEAGRFELWLAPLDPATLVSTVADIVRVRAEEKNLRFDYQLPRGLPSAVLADEQRLRQALLNLLTNAVKFTDQGQVSLSATLVRLDAISARLRFEVSDTGVGIAPRHLETIFEPFEQVGDPARRRAGTGLGLAISRQLVRLMGSELHVDSRPGQGSRFWFEIECRLTPLPLAGTPANGAWASGDVSPAGTQSEAANDLPSLEHMETLHKLARLGNMRHIRDYATHLADSEPRCRPFARRLQGLAERYQSKAILALVEARLNELKAA